MKTLSELRTEVSAIIQDSSFSDNTIDTYLNDGLKDVAGRIFLPALESIDTVDTTVSQNYSSLPSDFNRSIHRCYSNDNNRQIKVYANVPLLFRQFLIIDQAGQVVGVAAKGSNLFYQRIPASAEELQIHYSSQPTALSDDDDEPDCLPDHLCEELLVNFACRKIFAQIEDGVEGQKINTTYHDGMYKTALGSLIDFIGPDALNPYRDPQEFEDDMGLESYL